MAFEQRDFRFKPQAPMASIVQAYQNKAAQEMQGKQMEEQAKQRRLQETLGIIQSASGLVQQGVQMSAARLRKDNQSAYAELLAKQGTELGHAPASMLESTMASQKTQQQAAFMKAYPTAGAKEQAKSLFGSPKASTAVSHQTKQVLLDGIPAIVDYNPKTMKYWHKGKELPSTASVEPFDPNAVPDITDKHMEKYGGLAQMMIEGKATGSQLVRARGKEKTIINLVAIKKAEEMGVDFDPTLVKQRETMRRQYTPQGMVGKNIIALNTVTGHLDSLKKAGTRLNNKKLRKYNSVANYIKHETGSPEVVRYEFFRDAVGDELARVFQGSGVVAQQAKEEMRANMDSANSPEQLEGAISAAFELMQSRLIEIKYSWEGTMSGVTPPIPFVNPKNMKLLKSWGYNPETLEKNSSSRGGNDLGDGWSYEVTP